MITLDKIHKNYDTDKGIGHSYIETYDLLFARLQHQPVNVCEIGSLTCGSLKMFEEYFTQAQIYGIDNWSQSSGRKVVGFSGETYSIDQLTETIARLHPRITLITCDSTDKQQVDAALAEKTFHIILDDGDHTPHAQFKTFTNMFAYLDNDGYYIIEDVGDLNGLLFLLNEYKKSSELAIKIESFPFYKDKRHDDVLVIITKN